MAENSKIEWTHHTVNLWWGCTRVHAGCDNCYAATLAHRRKPHLDLWDKGTPRLQIQSSFKDLEKYQRKAAAVGEVHRVFIGSMMDIFEKEMPLINKEGEPAIDASDGSPIGNEFLRHELFSNISKDMYPNLMFLFLTKRPSNINKMIPEDWKANPPRNVMFGTSPVDQQTAITLISQLAKVNGRKFLSVEPLLDYIDITNRGIQNGYSVQTRYDEEGRGIEWTDPGDKFIGVDWVICGGESGAGRRSFNTEWAYALRDQCAKAGTPFFMKQIDKVIPIPEDLFIRQFPNQ